MAARDGGTAIRSAGLAAGLLYLRARAPYRGYTGTEQFVEIPLGARSLTIGERLVAGGVIRDAQTYRLADWRVAGDEVNYRRFFDVNNLAAVRMEVPEVFEAPFREK